VTVSGLALALMAALLVLSLRRRPATRLVLAAALLALALSLIPSAAHLVGLDDFRLPIVAVGVLAPFILGPLLLLYIRRVAGHVTPHTWVLILHLVPVLAAALTLLVTPTVSVRPPEHTVGWDWLRLSPLSVVGPAVTSAYLLVAAL